MLRFAVGAVTVFVALGAVLLLRTGNAPDLGHAAQERPTGVAYHRFTPSFIGDVWMRITAAGQHTGEVHRVTLRWGRADG